MDRFNNPAFPCQFSNYTLARAVRRPRNPTTWIAPVFAVLGFLAACVYVFAR